MVREGLLRKKTRELRREVRMMKLLEEASSHVRMLTQEIRRSLDRHMILHTTLVELSKVLFLHTILMRETADAKPRFTCSTQCPAERPSLGTRHDIRMPQHRQVSRNIDLVYGGGSIGLMGLVSQAVYDGGRHVIGVIPKTLMPREITGETVGEVKAVADMHQRKAEMARQSDAFIALPGGYGTLEELLEVITWAQLGIHDKPVTLEATHHGPLVNTPTMFVEIANHFLANPLRIVHFDDFNKIVLIPLIK